MAYRINVKLIVQLHDAGISRNVIASSRHMSRSSVTEVIHTAEEKGISYDQIKDKPDDEVYRLFFPDKASNEQIYDEPDFDLVHKELAKPKVTLKILWNEYQDQCTADQKIPMGYTRFCEHYRAFTATHNLTSRVEHRPGARCEVDWSGPTMSYIDKTTGESVKVYLFVACLPYSQYTYVEPTLNMKMDSWLRCHINMYAFFGGVPNRTVCDNLKTGVQSHPKEGEIILTEEYEALGMHYVTAIMPAPVRAPKAKASVEGNVGKIGNLIIGTFRNTAFTSFDDLKEAVARKVKEYNDAPFQKREGSRAKAFEEEKQYLRPLPAVPYEIAKWSRGHKVDRRNFHVSYDKNYYSVPYQYADQKADLRITDRCVEIFVNNSRVATHKRFPAYVNYKYSTLPEHMPPQMVKQEWTKERIEQWASQIGPNTRKVIDLIFDSCRIKEQGYNPSLSVLKLSDSYSQERLENACELALTKYHLPRYRHLKALLLANQDILWKESNRKDHQPREDKTGYLRGEAYYGGRSDD